MNVECANQSVTVIGDKQRSYLVLLEHVYGLRGKNVFGCRLAVGVHDFGHRRRVHVGAVVERAAQVAVGEYTENAAIVVDHGCHAEAFLRHLHQAVAQPHLGPGRGNFLARPHHVAHAQQQPLAEAAARVRAREVLGRKAPVLEQRHGQRVAHRQRRRRARGRGKIERAGLLGHADIEVYVGDARKCRFRIAGHGHEFGAHALDQWQDSDDLFGFARIGNGEYQVLRRDHSQVTVARFRGVHEKRGRAGAGERRGNL